MDGIRSSGFPSWIDCFRCLFVDWLFGCEEDLRHIAQVLRPLGEEKATMLGDEFQASVRRQVESNQGMFGFSVAKKLDMALRLRNGLQECASYLAMQDASSVALAHASQLAPMLSSTDSFEVSSACMEMVKSYLTYDGFLKDTSADFYGQRIAIFGMMQQEGIKVFLGEYFYDLLEQFYAALDLGYQLRKELQMLEMFTAASILTGINYY